MAEARLRGVPSTNRVPEFTDMELTLTREEAVFLQCVLGHIGGPPKFTARRIADDISKAISGAGLPWYACLQAGRGAFDGSITCIKELTL